MLSKKRQILVQCMLDMQLTKALGKQLRVNRHFAVPFVSIVVGAHGFFILATTLLEQLSVRRGSPLTAIVIDLPLLIGLSLIYLSTQLRRHKRTAWLVTVLAYSFYLGIGVAALLMTGWSNGILLTGLKPLSAHHSAWVIARYGPSK